MFVVTLMIKYDRLVKSVKEDSNYTLNTHFFQQYLLNKVFWN